MPDSEAASCVKRRRSDNVDSQGIHGSAEISPKRQRSSNFLSSSVSCSDSVESANSEIGFAHEEHPADIVLHSWAPTMTGALEQLVLSMYRYMLEENQKVDEVYDYYFTASGSDLQSMIFSVLDEALVAFQSEPFFVGNHIKVEEVDRNKFSVSFSASGETFDLSKHKQGTDVKAITYSNMQIHETPNRVDLYVTIDI